MKKLVISSVIICCFHISCEKEDPKVSVDFSVESQMVEINSNVTFTDLSTGKVKNWEWTFEGGTPSSSILQNPIVKYSTPGVYNVTLKASNNSKDETIIKEDFIIAHNLLDGLVAYFPFDGNTNDQSSKNIDGTNSGAILTSDRFDSANSALSFDGIDDHVDCTTDNRSITNKFTISVWIQTTASVTQAILAKYDWSNGYLFRTYTAGTTSIGGRDGSAEYLYVPTPATIVNDGLWHHLVATVDINIWQLWIDGVNTGSFNSGSVSANFASSDPLTIGNSARGENGTPDWFFSGKIDDIAIYNRVLSAVDIEMLREYGIDD